MWAEFLKPAAFFPQHVKHFRLHQTNLEENFTLKDIKCEIFEVIPVLICWLVPNVGLQVSECNAGK